MADTNELTQSRTVRNGGVGCVYELDWHQATSGNKIAGEALGGLGSQFDSSQANIGMLVLVLDYNNYQLLYYDIKNY